MVRNFEKETDDLTEQERTILLPLMVRSLQKHIGRDSAVTNRRMREGLSEMGYVVADSRIRKLINYIRVKGLVPCLMANGYGYFVAEDVTELKDYIYGLGQRVEAIQAVINCLKEQQERLEDRTIT